ncbi:nucleobase:cation symporter [Marinobacterium aestuarii]|uniref:Nucleobase:cation symporter n=1 Tax=Marinobacterium aestuarii TaxID=1821621 RepID=A0A1A9F0T8_9GAMM|nr:solute carrier family 23 protein [Marinobacterium aestuarii]ANG63610.1 nucleobase:cation symporter [Marinobacterium aestuarii]
MLNTDTVGKTAPVDEKLPLRTLLAFGLQHVLVMAASPIASVFLMSRILGFDADLTASLLSATFLICGLGTLLQSIGYAGFGSRLPFIMLPGGAPIILFIQIAQQYDAATASGAVILTGLFYFIVLPVFKRLLRFFPSMVIGTMLLLVGVNLVKILGLLIVGRNPEAADFADPGNIFLAFVTIALTVLMARFLTGIFKQLAILGGLIGGTLIAFLIGAMHTENFSLTPLVGVPEVLPFGMPTFDIIAALPLMIFCMISMVEATGQTVAISEVVGKELDKERDVARTIRGDAIISFLGGFFGTSLIITSGENIGVVQATGIRSRWVTVAAGCMLIVISFLAPFTSAIQVIPDAVIGGTGLVLFAIVGVMGIEMLRRTDLRDSSNMYVVAVALAVGLFPILVPGAYSNFPTGIAAFLGNGVAAGAITAAVLNAIFHHTQSAPQSEPELAPLDKNIQSQN